MNRTGIVMKREYGEMRRTVAFRIILIIAAAVTVAASAGISIALNLQSWFGEHEAAPLMDLFTSLVLYFLPLLILLTFIGAFGNLPVIKEKANGNLACLMATPLTPRALWIGKSMAIFLPAYIVTVMGTVITVLVMNLAAFIPAGYGLVLPVPALVLGLVVNPLLFGGLLLFIGLLTNTPGMAVPACIVGGIGGLLYYQNLTGHWESWSYAWALIPGFVGVGILLSGLLGEGKKPVREGLNLIMVSMVMFAVFGSFFGALGMVGNYWPVLLIVLGAFIMVRSFTRR